MLFILNYYLWGRLLFLLIAFDLFNDDRYMFAHYLILDNIFHLFDFNVVARRNAVKQLMELNCVVLLDNFFTDLFILIEPIEDMNLCWSNILLEIVHYVIKNELIYIIRIRVNIYISKFIDLFKLLIYKLASNTLENTMNRINSR